MPTSRRKYQPAPHSQGLLCLGLLIGWAMPILAGSTTLQPDDNSALPPALELQVKPYRCFGAGQADASPAAINPPDGLAFTLDGLLLATDALNHRIQIFNPLTGEHLGSIGEPNLFTGEIVNIVPMLDGAILVSDETANQTYRLARATNNPIAFQPAGPPLFAGEGFTRLCGLAADADGRIYVVDGKAGDVRRYRSDFSPDPTWQFQKIRPDREPMLCRSEGIAIDAKTRTLFLTSEWEGAIRVFDLDTGHWRGQTIGRSTDAQTGKLYGPSVFSTSVEGLAIFGDYLLAVDEGDTEPARKHPGHLLIFDLRSPALYDTNADTCRTRTTKGLPGGLIGWMGCYRSPDGVAVFPGSTLRPEPLIAVADQGAYQVLVFRWDDILAALRNARMGGALD